MVKSQDVQLEETVEQVLHLTSQAVHVLDEESHIVVLLHSQKPVTEFIVCVAYGQVAHEEPELQVEHDESQAMHVLSGLL